MTGLDGVLLSIIIVLICLVSTWEGEKERGRKEFAEGEEGRRVGVIKFSVRKKKRGWEKIYKN